ncbi:MAG: hypothetical protein OEZ30_04905 [Candidatus Aminicenantes bacterium]|nr:hypothetical protein [Candidatus Aminicenantes bacterium]MDH5714884.1 hypothetical protein [Candidatus Aminicenantes bacterium]
MSFADDFKTSLREIKDFLIKAGHAAADVLSKFSEDSHLRYKIYQLQRRLGELHRELGAEVYHLYTEKKMGMIEQEENVATLIQKIGELKTEIEKKEEERLKLKTAVAPNMEKEPENQTIS